MRTAILMLNLGGPTRLEDVETFLVTLLSDPEIISFPFSRFFQLPLARFIARRRAPIVRARYAEIGGGSPIVRWTEAQASGLVARLGASFAAFPCMRYAPPDTKSALSKALDFGADRILLLPLYPQYSTATSGSSEREVARWTERLGIRLPVSSAGSWAEHPGYLDAIARRVRAALDSLPAGERDAAFVLFSAHSLPMKFVEAGDPYPAETKATVNGVLQRLRAPNPWGLAYQSRLGPVRWLGPSVEDELERIAKAGHKTVVVSPVSFVSDHIETLHELDIELRDEAKAAGIPRFVRASSLNDGSDFLDALADVVRRALLREDAA